jgi:hypothetical protein
MKSQIKEALEAELLKGLHSGEAKVMTDKDWESLKREVAQQLRAGNEAESTNDYGYQHLKGKKSSN